MKKPADRIQKILASQGLASRREIERWIEAGRISLNGKPARLGDCYSPGDRLSIDGKPVHFKSITSQPILGLMYYKPEGEVTTRSDEQGRKTIFDSLPECESGRWINVGRLDLNTSGLMLLVNNGELANRLMHPKYKMLRQYAARVLGKVSDEQVNAMLEGVMLEDGKASFESIVDAGGRGSNHWYHVSLREGRTREVRRLWESQHIMVSRLIRIQYGPIKLDPALKAGQFRPLRTPELNQLLNEVGLPAIKLKRDGRKMSTAKGAGKQTGAGKTPANKDRPARKQPGRGKPVRDRNDNRVASSPRPVSPRKPRPNNTGTGKKTATRRSPSNSSTSRGRKARS